MNMVYDPTTDCPAAAKPADDGGYSDLRAKLYELLSPFPQDVAVRALRKTLGEWQTGLS